MELFDIVDEKGLPTGEFVERAFAHAEGHRHRTAHVWVVREVDDRFQVLLQKRAKNKDSFPGCFDTSSAGHIQAGDEPLESALRELKEELGIVATQQELERVGTFPIDFEQEFHGAMFRDKEVAFVFLYRKQFELADLTLQEEEVEAVEWFDLEKVYKECRAGNTKFCVPEGGLQLVSNYLYRQKRLEKEFEFRGVLPTDAERTTEVEAICFPPSEACTLPIMKERIAAASDCFLVAVDRATMQIIGFVNGLCTDEDTLRDELFTDTNLHNPQGKNIMICSVTVLPEYRGRGLARKMMHIFLQKQTEIGRKEAILTCVPEKITMYEKFGYTDRGESQSEWGGEKWHEMSCILN